MIEINNNLIKPIEVAKILGYSSFMIELTSQLEESILKHFNSNNKLIHKDDVIEFINNHTSLIKLRDEILSFHEIKLHSLESRIRESLETIGVKLIIISNRAQFIYLSNRDYDKAIEFYKLLANNPDRKVFTKSEIAEKLKLSNYGINDILETYKLTPYFQQRKYTCYHINQVEPLLKEQQIQIKRMKEYITINELTDYLGYNKSSVLNWIKRNNVKTISPPLIAKIKSDNFDYTGKRKFILKKFANQYIEMTEFRKKLDETFEYYNVDLDPFTSYKEVLKLYGFHFLDFAQRTNQYWDIFVRKKINETIARDLEGLVHSFVLLTGFLMNVVNHARKELFQFSTKELNFALLNDGVPYTYKVQYYSFINKIHQGLVENGGVSVFDLKNLRSPKVERLENHKAKDKEIYKPVIYVTLTEYCSDVDLHAGVAISDAKKWSDKEYNYYANMWLYVMLQLTNAWRHSDVVDFPRLEMYKDKDLDWLISNPISKDDAKIIVAYYEHRVYIHNKNQQDRYLIISDDLEQSFATSVLICEFIQRQKNDMSESIFDFGNKSNKPSDIVHQSFFEYFSYKSFRFENRKMNWTVITLATDVISKITGRNPLEIAKFLRNHSDSEVTNIYIQLPEEYVEFIIKQLFNLGSFGYIFDGLAKLLLDEEPQPLQHNNALMIKNIFHDPIIVEGIAKQIRIVNEEQNYVINVLKGLPKEELKEKLDYLNLGLIRSKKEGYQCLLGGVQNCPKKTADCNRCSFSVPNRFALISLAYDVEKTMNELQIGFNSTQYEAEKIRLANGLFVQLSLLRTSIEKFGRDVVNQFIPGGLDRINERLTQLPETRSMVTSGVGSWLVEEGITIP